MGTEQLDAADSLQSRLITMLDRIVLSERREYVFQEKDRRKRLLRSSTGSPFLC
jgi:hypothetical protein